MCCSTRTPSRLTLGRWISCSQPGRYHVLENGVAKLKTWDTMQVLQAGNHRLLYLELDPKLVETVIRQAGYECQLQDHPRHILAELRAPGRERPLLLFDACDPTNGGWFARCQFYADGLSGNVLQTPFALGNLYTSDGELDRKAVRLQIYKELPISFRLPGRPGINEQAVYGVLYQFLRALQETGVAVCGHGVLRPLLGGVHNKPVTPASG